GGRAAEKGSIFMKVPLAGKFRLESSGWKVQAGKFRLESSGWKVQAGKFRLESSGWKVQAGKFGLDWVLLGEVHF
ncbi:MAG: hypothetical protein IJD43_13955, partial [Thermoguttaceae bacterium]|nr:hypothetical protein [Thermoguttaceae bacterium]